ncbi:MAG: phosphatidate cytidylyltransferase [Candidatus Omnitrophica bacterium]|nr:phosphatidate cytidylyltransferase [Candidatus Omnitrophota bacterium]
MLKHFARLSNGPVRILTTAVLVASILVVIWKLPYGVFTAVVGVFAALGLMEFFNMAGRAAVPFIRPAAVLWGALLALSPNFVWDEAILGSGLFALFIYLMTRREERVAALAPMAVITLGWLYVGWCLSFFNKIRLLPDGNMWLCYVLFTAKLCDMGAYVVGNRWGRTPLARTVSPRKSVEGAAGGILAALLFTVIFTLFVREAPFWHTFVLGLVIGGVAQAGDLAESLLKREAGFKDSSGWVPGLGGVLDLVDSLIFTAPVAYVYLTWVIGV